MTPSLQAITIDPVTGVLEVAKDELDFESKPTFSVTVRVDDNGVDPHPMFATATVSISLNDVNEPPVLVEGQVLSVPENSAVGTAVNPNVHASDPDAGDKISFAMATHPALYMVGSTIKVADKSLMDHETDASYTVSVRAPRRSVCTAFHVRSHIAGSRSRSPLRMSAACRRPATSPCSSQT